MKIIAAMNQEKILSSKLEALFPNIDTREGAIDRLDEYGKESHECETIRVRLAILKLTGSDLDKIIDFTESAKRDYRDILSLAEYPRQSKNLSVSDSKKKQKLVDEDRAEYLEWLDT